MWQQGPGWQAVWAGGALAVQWGLGMRRDGGLASRPSQRLQRGVWGGQPLWVQGGRLLGMGVRSWSRWSLAGGLGGRGGALWRDRSDRGRGPWCGKLGGSWWGRGSWSSPAGSLQGWGLGLQHLLLGGGVRVTLVVLRAGDAGGCTAIVLVDVFGVTAALIVDTAAVRTLSLAFGRRVGPADLLGLRLLGAGPVSLLCVGGHLLPLALGALQRR